MMDIPPKIRCLWVLLRKGIWFDGSSFEISIGVLGCEGLLWVLYRHPPPKARGDVVGWRAGWCMVGTWVGAPPEWRMEERYLKNLEDVKGRDYTVKRDKANGRISYNIKIVKESI